MTQTEHPEVPFMDIPLQ